MKGLRNSSVCKGPEARESFTILVTGKQASVLRV